MKETILLVDGDTLAFRSAVALETRSVDVLHLESGKVKTFDTRTEFRKRLKEKHGEEWKLKEQGYTYTDKKVVEDVSHACYTVKTRLKNLQAVTGADRIEVYVSGDSNFRDTLPLPSLYKGSRVGMEAPVHLAAVKEYMQQVHGALKSHEQETDDVVNIRAWQEMKLGNTAVLAAQDKDAYQTPGLIIYDYTVAEPELFKVPTFGYIEEKDNKSKSVFACGLMLIAYQLLHGDSVDDYKPSELAPVKYGSKSAMKDIQNCSTAQELLDVVIGKYKSWYPEPITYKTWDETEVTKSWDDLLELFFKCCYMRREWDDKTTWRDYFKENGWVEQC